MIVCDICKTEIEDNYIQISLRGYQRMKIYDLGFNSTNFDVCSPNCAIQLLKQIKLIIPQISEVNDK